jgi:hypothetical protein
MSDRITVKADVSVKESAEFKNLQHRAVAGETEEEILKRHTIGKLADDYATGEPGPTEAD